MLAPFNILYSIFIFITGLFFGSFLNVVADRLACEQTLSGRSKCDTCKRTLSWLDLIPIISFTLLKGKCRYCQASISIQYPLSELATGVIFLLTWILSNIYYPNGVIFLHIAHIAIASCLFVIFLSDYRYQIIPDEIHVALVLFGLFRYIFLGTNIFVDQSDLISKVGVVLVSGVVVMLPLLLIFLFTRGRGMGFGDVKFAYIMGFLLGMKDGLTALYIGFVIGGIIGGLLMIGRLVKLKSKIAFGPFLIIGVYIMLFFYEPVHNLIELVYGIS